MILKRNRKLLVLMLATFILSSIVFAGKRRFHGLDDAWGPRYSAQPQTVALLSSPLTVGVASTGIHRWNRIAINASGLDHTPVAPGENRVFGEQLGPGRAARAMAIAHIAIFEAVNAIAGGYQSYTGLARAGAGTSMNAAIAQAAHDTLVALFPSQKASFDELLAEDLGQIADGFAKADGITLGRRAAKSILAQRLDDGSRQAEPRVGVDFILSNDPGKWRQDPISLIPLALGAHWGEVRPFVLLSSNQFRLPPPPAMDSPEYAAAFNEAKRLGGDGVVTPTERTAEQTEIGIYWAYDGTPSLCAPPRLYNQIAVQIADQMGSNTVELARLLALMNVAMADAGIAIWESKYFYQCWRPITGIREA
ncbi:MAG TPA: vanadium-dependent haloperoxidase, partial [Blastocatellia bacterium]